MAEDRESVVTEDDLALFSQAEVRDICDLKHCGNDHVEVTCACTSSYYGDAVGTLSIFANGVLKINCDCFRGCKEDKLTPAAFEKHSRKEGVKNWKNNIWVLKVAGEKVPLAETALLKYYNQALRRSRADRVRHRDEFLRCTQCNKLRRFHLRTPEDCRAYHDASINHDWKCSDMPHHNFRKTCDDLEERARRRVYRGCLRSSTCEGCTSCVCFGCATCRFSDCGCRTCIDFMRNTTP